MADIYAMKSGNGALGMVSDAASRSSVEIEANGDKSYDNRDDREMAYMGKKQQLMRNFGFMSMLGFSCTIMITWEGIFTVFIYGLENGGPAGLVYGYLFCWFGFFTVIISLAEMVSMAPTAGGQYHWTFIFAPKEYRNFLSFITGWQSVLAWQACLASPAYLGGTLIQGLLVLNYPNTYDFQRWHGTLLLYAVLLLALFINTIMASQLPNVEGAMLIIHVVGFFGILITLVYLAPHGTPHDVFVKYLTIGGYSPGVSFFVGLITTVFAFLGADGAIHMCEEIKNASTVVPQSLTASIGMNGLLGFAMLLAILFCIGDIDNALSSTTGFPFIEIFRQATGSASGASAMTALIILMMLSSTIAVLASCSRMTWAFARDNGLPFSQYLMQVEPRSKLPLFSICTSVIISMLLGLINIGSATAFNAVASLVVAGFLGSYTLPIVLLLHKRIRNPDSVKYGPWSLGRFGIATNIFALGWIVIVMVFSFFPAALPITLETMNWSCLLWGATMISGIGYYFLFQRGLYNGPVVDTTAIEQFYGT